MTKKCVFAIFFQIITDEIILKELIILKQLFTSGSVIYGGPYPQRQNIYN
jgi:hypothetical protein